jgi:hypothetical protein
MLGLREHRARQSALAERSRDIHAAQLGGRCSQTLKTEHAGERFARMRDEERAVLAGVVVRKPIDLLDKRARNKPSNAARKSGGASSRFTAMKSVRTAALSLSA